MCAALIFFFFFLLEMSVHIQNLHITQTKTACSQDWEIKNVSVEIPELQPLSDTEPLGLFDLFLGFKKARLCFCYLSSQRRNSWNSWRSNQLRIYGQYRNASHKLLLATLKASYWHGCGANLSISMLSLITHCPLECMVVSSRKLLDLRLNMQHTDKWATTLCLPSLVCHLHIVQ